MHCYQNYHSLIFKTIFFVTCSEVWEQATLIYTNDTQCLYGVSKSSHSCCTQHLNGTLAEYLGKLHALLNDINELLPLAPTSSQELEQRSKFFMFWVCMAFLMIILMFVIKFWDLLSCPILLPLVLPFYVCQVNTPLISRLMLMTLLL